MFDGSILAALTFSIISQATGGIVFAVAMQRGGNLIAPTAVHVLSHFSPGGESVTSLRLQSGAAAAAKAVFGV